MTSTCQERIAPNALCGQPTVNGTDRCHNHLVPPQCLCCGTYLPGTAKTHAVTEVVEVSVAYQHIPVVAEVVYCDECFSARQELNTRKTVVLP